MQSPQKCCIFIIRQGEKNPEWLEEVKNEDITGKTETTNTTGINIIMQIPTPSYKELAGTLIIDLRALTQTLNV